MKTYDEINPVYSRHGGCESFHRKILSGELDIWEEIGNIDGIPSMNYDFVSPRYIRSIKGASNG